VGHHLQNVMGIVPSPEAARSLAADPGRFAIAVELQADCFAGVWAYHANKTNSITRNDIEEAMAVLKNMGGDRLHRSKAGAPLGMEPQSNALNGFCSVGAPERLPNATPFKNSRVPHSAVARLLEA
jgi:hypothetical protein